MSSFNPASSWHKPASLRQPVLANLPGSSQVIKTKYDEIRRLGPLSDGSDWLYSAPKTPQAVIDLPLYQDKGQWFVSLNLEKRPTLGDKVINIEPPGGIAPEGDYIEAQAEKEVLEEQSGHPVATLLLSQRPYNTTSSNQMQVFYCTSLLEKRSKGTAVNSHNDDLGEQERIQGTLEVPLTTFANPVKFEAFCNQQLPEKGYPNYFISTHTGVLQGLTATRFPQLLEQLSQQAKERGMP